MGEFFFFVFFLGLGVSGVVSMGFGGNGYPRQCGVVLKVFYCYMGWS